MTYQEDARENNSSHSCKVCGFGERVRGFKRRDLLILKMRAGFIAKGKHPMTYEQIGQELGLCRERVRFILKGVFKLLDGAVLKDGKV
jgi:DNA-directed RNA polymerase sigma subunit (sigma70/sigma32)